MMSILDLLMFFQAKHFVIDFLLQGPYQYLNKGKYGHPGGLLHAGLHGIGASLCLLGQPIHVMIGLSLFDAIAHYHIDWFKVFVTKECNLDFQSKYFWWLLGYDQYLHQVTYCIILRVIL
jgi:hypothetical protein